MLTHVDVTEEHIRDGIPGTCFDCPVALAIKSVVSGGLGVVVTNRLTIQAFGGVILLRSDLPSRVRNFIRCFDEWHSVQPFAFDIDIPDEFLAKPTETP